MRNNRKTNVNTNTLLQPDIGTHAQQLMRTLLDNDYPNKLVAAYVQLLLSWDSVDTLQDVVDLLNAETGLNTTPAKLMDWRNGGRKCPSSVRGVMRRSIAQYLFDDRNAEALASLFLFDE